MRRGTPSAILMGRLVAIFRTNNGVTLRQVAAKLKTKNTVGSSAAYISQIEHGQRALKKKLLPH